MIVKETRNRKKNEGLDNTIIPQIDDISSGTTVQTSFEKIPQLYKNRINNPPMSNAPRSYPASSGCISDPYEPVASYAYRIQQVIIRNLLVCLLFSRNFLLRSLTAIQDEVQCPRWWSLHCHCSVALSIRPSLVAFWSTPLPSLIALRLVKEEGQRRAHRRSTGINCDEWDCRLS